MELVLIVIMLLVCFSLVLKLTYLPLLGRLAVCLACALFIVSVRAVAARQSGAQIADWIQNPGLMLDVAVLLTLDVVLQSAFCILSAKTVAGEKMSKAGAFLRQFTLWVPGILILPALFALLLEVLFSFPGENLAVLAWTLASLVFLAGLGLPFLIAKFIPEADLRLELIFMVNAMIALLGVVATVNGRTAVAGVDNVEWRPLLGVVLLLALGAAFGYFYFRYNNHKKLSHRK